MDKYIILLRGQTKTPTAPDYNTVQHHKNSETLPTPTFDFPAMEDQQNHTASPKHQKCRTETRQTAEKNIHKTLLVASTTPLGKDQASEGLAHLRGFNLPQGAKVVSDTRNNFPHNLILNSALL